MSQKQGMTLIEQGFQELIKNEISPQIDTINKEISKSQETFDKIKKEASETLQSVKNAVDESVKKNINDVKEDLEKRSTRTSKKFDSLSSRIEEIERRTEGVINYSLHVNDMDKATQKYEFVYPENEELQGVRYHIDGSERYAKVEGGVAKGSFIKSSKIQKGYGEIEFEKNIDKGKDTLQLDLKRDSITKKIDDLESTIRKMSKEIEEMSSFRTRIIEFFKKQNEVLNTLVQGK